MFNLLLIILLYLSKKKRVDEIKCYILIKQNIMIIIGSFISSQTDLNMKKDVDEYTCVLCSRTLLLN